MHLDLAQNESSLFFPSPPLPFLWWKRSKGVNELEEIELTLISSSVKGPCPADWDLLVSWKVTGCYFWLLLRSRGGAPHQPYQPYQPWFPVGVVGRMLGKDKGLGAPVRVPTVDWLALLKPPWLQGTGTSLKLAKQHNRKCLGTQAWFTEPRGGDEVEAGSSRIPRWSSPLGVSRVSLGHSLLLEWGLSGWGVGERQVGRGANEEDDSCSSGLTSPLLWDNPTSSCGDSWKKFPSFTLILLGRKKLTMTGLVLPGPPQL